MAHHEWTDAQERFAMTFAGTAKECAEAMTVKFGKRFTGSMVSGKLSRLHASHASRVDQHLDALTSSTAKKKYDQKVHDDAFTKLLLNTLEAAIRPVDFKQPKFTVPQVDGHPETAVLQLSDWHFGKATSTYNIATACKRFDEITDKVMSIVGLHRKAYPVDNLNIFMLGDMVDGSAIYPNQPMHIETHAVEQVIQAADHIVGRLCDLASYFKRVDVSCVRGNHGRTSKFAHENENWDTMLYHTLRIATKNIPNLRWDISDSWYLLVPVERTTFLLNHGDQIKMYQNIPMYGVTMRVSRWATTKKLRDFDIYACGHFHSEVLQKWNNKRITMNGTASADDEFALERMGLESSEMQQFYGVSARRPGSITWHYPLEFEELG